MVEAEDREWSGRTAIPVTRWVLITGSRGVLAVGLAILLSAVTFALVTTDLVYVGAGTALVSVLSSGMIAALATIVTVTLSINQLILSRVFGSPADLTDRLEGNLEFRQSIEDVAGVDTSPNDPGSFLSLLASSLEQRAAELDRITATADVDDEIGTEIQSFTTDLVEYAEHLGTGEELDRTYEVLSLIFGTEYADYIDDARRLDQGSSTELPDAATDHIAAILTLLKGIATIRQFFKTLAIQQDLASLSRKLIYTGVPAIVAAYYLAISYRSPGLASSIPDAVLPVAVAVGTGVFFLPLLVLISYILRVATVTLYTVSVGSFVPPEERVGGP